jgi:hypothetical protein
MPVSDRKSALQMIVVTSEFRITAPDKSAFK